MDALEDLVQSYINQIRLVENLPTVLISSSDSQKSQRNVQYV